MNWSDEKKQSKKHGYLFIYLIKVSEHFNPQFLFISGTTNPRFRGRDKTFFQNPTGKFAFQGLPLLKIIKLSSWQKSK